MGDPQLILTALLIPFVAIPVIALVGRWPNVRETVSVVAGLALLTVNINLASKVFAGQRPTVTLGEFLPSVPVSFTIEPLGMVFALVASGLWIPTTLYALGYMRGHHEKNQTRFFMCFASAIFAAMAAAYAGNLFTLFVAYEIMTVTTYPLVTHHGNEAARSGGRTYLGILITTSIGFFLLAVAWTGSIAGTTDFVPGGLLSTIEMPTWQIGLLMVLFAFGIGKAALMPFHRWLPAAMVAPTPVSALLHAVAVVKVGVFSILKVAVYTFGASTLSQRSMSDGLAYLAGFSILAASLVAMRQDNLKRRLAYSTISQLAYITLGAFIATESSIIGGGMHIVMHAVAKITLFFCAGAIYIAHHKTEISSMRGLGRKMPLTFAAFAIACVSIIGLPPGGGAWSKWFLALGTVEDNHLPLTAALMISSLLNIAYLLPIPALAFMKPTADPNDEVGHDDDGHHDDAHSHDDGHSQDENPIHLFGGKGWLAEEAPAFCVFPLCATAIASVLTFFFAGDIYSVLQPILLGATG